MIDELTPAHAYAWYSSHWVSSDFGTEVDGKLTRSDLLITSSSASHELKRQHFITADGAGRQWLAVQYEYRR